MTALVPIAVIPQIILAGVVVLLSGSVRWVAQGLITVYWARQALESLLPDADLAFLLRPNEGFLVPWAIVPAQAAMSAAATVVVLGRTEGTGRRAGSRPI